MTQCSQCGLLDITMVTAYTDNTGIPLGIFPLYFWGARPSEPHLATAYFCGPGCASKYAKELRDAT